MKIITTIEEMMELGELITKLPEHKPVKRLIMQGFLCEAHHGLINHIRTEFPESIIIVQYQEMIPILYDYLLWDKLTIYPDEIKKAYYHQIISTAEINPEIDYLVLRTTTPKKVKNFLARTKLDFIQHMWPYAQKNGINRTLAVECMFIQTMVDPIRKRMQELGVTPNFEVYGAKSVVHSLIYNKVFGYRYPEKPKNAKDCAIWKFFKNDQEGVLARSTGVSKLSFIRKLVKKELDKGVKTQKELTVNTMRKYLLVDKCITILDLDTMESIPEVTDNCAICMMCLGGNDFIYIRNGEIIY